MLSSRELKAVNNYMRGMTEAEAMRQAGYASATARRPHVVFKKPEVVEEINRRRDRLTKANELSEQWIVERLMKVADANLGDIVEFDSQGSLLLNYEKMDEKMRYALQGIEVEETVSGRGSHSSPVKRMKVRHADKLRALEMLGKYLGMFKDKVEVSGDQELVNRLYKARERVNSASDV